MRDFKRFLRRYAKRLVAIAIMLSLFGLAQLPSLSANERQAIASRFQFTRLPLPELVEYPPQPPFERGELGEEYLRKGKYRKERSVNPSLERHSAWISAVGAAVALNDLDGDGLPNDVCYVEVRSDRAIVAPVPGTGDRYQPFELKPTGLPYDSATMAPMGCLPGDMNEDGRMDILVYYWGRTPVAFVSNVGAQGLGSQPSYLPQEIVIPPNPPSKGGNWKSVNVIPSKGGDGEIPNPKWYTNGATFADLDGDGHQDLIIGNYFQDGSEILNVNATGTEEMQDSMTRAYNGGKNRVLLWAGAKDSEAKVVFKEAAGVFNEYVAQGWTLGVGTADLDGDLLPEIYFANDFGPDHLLHNRSTPGHLQFALLEGQKGLNTANSKVLGHDSFKGMGVDFGDINQDGLLDIYVSNIADEYALEESHFLFVSTGELGKMERGIAPYVDRSEPLGVSRSGWGWETKFGDFDNDGELEALQATGFRKGEIDRWPELQELALGNDQLLRHPNSWFSFQPSDDLSGHNSNPFFVRGADGRYYDLAKELGLAQPYVTRGIATADVDGDGDLDFAIANQWEDSYFYRNDSPHAGGFLGLRLVRDVDLTPPTPLPSKGRGEKDSPLQNHNSSLASPLAGGTEGGQGQDFPPQNHNSFLASPLAGGTEGGRSTPAIGATATVHLPDGRELVAQVDGGNGHSGARSPELHFGLGEIQGDVPLPVDLQWRDTSGQVHRESLLLSPGWHEVRLGEAAKPA